MTQYLEKLPDGSFIDWGRHWGKPDTLGGAVVFRGEDAKVLDLVLKHTRPETEEKKDD